MDIIDNQGYRRNVGIVVFKDEEQLLLGRRDDSFSWQFPQGGIHQGETEEQSLYRELMEEVGLAADDVELIYKSNEMYTYDIPDRYMRRSKPGQKQCIGQKQRWFLLRLDSDESKISLTNCDDPEFNEWTWLPPDEVVKQAIFFKQGLYFKVLKEFESYFSR